MDVALVGVIKALTESPADKSSKAVNSFLIMLTDGPIVLESDRRTRKEALTKKPPAFFSLWGALTLKYRPIGYWFSTRVKS